MVGGVVEAVRAAVHRALVELGVPSRAVIVAAVSGGQDSVCLLDALGHALGSLGGRVVVGHVEHGIRGSESAEDAGFVEALAGRQGIPYTVVGADVPAYARRHRLGLEEASRVVRYQALAAIVERHGAWAVATGHTTDDLAETLLINIVRGTSTTGVRSIQPQHELAALCLGSPTGVADAGHQAADRVRVIRPLLEVTRATTEEYCRARALDFRIDPTNLDPSFLRNRVRHHLLPLLRTYNPSIVAGLAHLARLATDDEAALEALTEGVWQSSARRCGEAVAFEWRHWLTLAPAVQRRLLRRSGRELGISGGWTFDAIESARLLLARRPVGRRLSLAGGVRLVTSRSGFRLESDSATADAPRPH